jgi:hypothetical protein
MYGGRVEEKHNSTVTPDSVATATTPPGADCSGDHSLIRTSIAHPSTSREGRRQLDTYMNLALKGFHVYIAESDKPIVDPSYLAWEDVRNIRAPELVGQILTPSGTELPYTGFEGYFVGKTPAEIITIEIALGQHILAGIHYEGLHEPYGITEYELKAALHGGKMRQEHVARIMEFFDCQFRETLARTRGTTPEVYANFRTETYRRVLTGETVTSTPITTITVLNTNAQIEAYMALAQIGIFGHPALKTIHESRDK